MPNSEDEYETAATALRSSILQMDPGLDPVRLEKIIADKNEHNRWATEYEQAHPGTKLRRAKV